MKLSLLDRAIAAVDPVRAQQRVIARARLAAYAALPDLHASASTGSGYTSTAGGDSFLSRWFVRPTSANADALRQLPSQRAQARALVRNNAIAASAINTNVVRAIGTGLACSPRPHLATLGWSAQQGAEWVAELKAEFSLWADSPLCDWYGDQNFYQLQDLATRARLESGDAFSVLPDGERTPTMPYALRVQLLEADRVGNPRGEMDTASVSGGIRRVDGRVTGVHVYRQHPGSAIASADPWAGDWIEPMGSSGRRRILHHFKRTRPEAARGVPYLAPVIALFKLLGDYSDAELKAAVVSAWLTMVIETPAGQTPAPVFQGADQPPAGGTQAPVDVEMGPGHVLGLQKGETASFNNPARPNPAFEHFVAAVLDQIGAGTFIGSEMLLKKFSTSYTAARAAFLDAWKHLLDVRTQTALDFCQPVFETWFAEAVALGRVRAPGFFADPRLRWAYTRCAWQGDSQGSLNPKDEVSAYASAVEARLLTRERAEWELFGTDWQETYGTKLAEHEQLAADGMLPAPKAGAAAPQTDESTAP